MTNVHANDRGGGERADGRPIRTTRRRTGDAEAHPDRRQREAGGDERERDQHDVEPDQAVLELGDHRRSACSRRRAPRRRPARRR